MNVLRGIDVSHWKGDLNSNGVAADFIIAKATGGTGYVDDTCDKFVQEAIAGGRKWGVFHYYSDGFGGSDVIAEANWFFDNCRGYIGKGLLVLDWEAGGNPHVNNPSMALQWLQHIENRARDEMGIRVKPIIYMSLSLVRSLNWSAVIQNGNGLWVAAWPDGNNIIPNYGINPAQDPNPLWDGVVNDVLWQFTSTGHLDGYGGNLDCNLFYGTREAWDSYAGVANPTPEPTTTTTQVPIPEPTTTTTTVAPEPEPTTTTTSTTVVEPPTSTTTTTITEKPPEEPALWVAVVVLVAAILTLLGNIIFR